MRTIQIDIEVHKAIEAERRELSESEDEILKRLLGLKTTSRRSHDQSPDVEASWRKDGVELPAGTRLRAVYSGQEVEGIVEDGRWLIGGCTYMSPSMALIHNVTTKDGSRTNLNGWNHWIVQKPGDRSFVRLGDLRAEARQRR